jgi:hypothetical protein
MSKQYDHPKVFKQVRADGSEYFYAEVTVRERWFFGLLTSKDRFYVNNNGETAYLYHSDIMQTAFNTFAEATTAAFRAIEKEKAEELHSEIVSYSEVEKPLES